MCRTNQTLKTRLSKLVAEHQTAWDEYLEEVAFSLHTQTLKTRLSKLVAEHQTAWDKYLEEVAFSLHTQT